MLDHSKPRGHWCTLGLAQKSMKLTASICSGTPRLISRPPLTMSGCFLLLRSAVSIRNPTRKPFGNFKPKVCRRPPDYSSNLCPPKTFAIWLFRRPKTPPKKSYSKCFRRTQIRWVIWRSSSLAGQLHVTWYPKCLLLKDETSLFRLIWCEKFCQSSIWLEKIASRDGWFLLLRADLGEGAEPSSSQQREVFNVR